LVFSNIYRKAILILFFAALLVVYWRFNPGVNRFFPKCPFYWLTGYRCMGCGSQRAIHSLLNLDFREAMKENMLVVISIPYLLTGFIFDSIKQPGEKMLRVRKMLFGYRAIIIVIVILVSFLVLRNLPVFQNYI
jgi:hypothetical protein